MAAPRRTPLDRLVHQLAAERPLVALTAIGHLETLIEVESPAAGEGCSWLVGMTGLLVAATVVKRRAGR
ncbi:hypothetical protein [Actinacidiphila oryziradicis]|uniref:Uncharacterized protein n=1 Tax=Actinacidiphila oryziradicis TaxID=2571141 RepID=A0A4U0SNP1_9ACTN|nr:hypothetical protein [Actinacidiphila oryziradicis]TKA01975.1 hypothetical protein FCI23_39570 [Actinacidiphila oryziradicis]